MDQWQPTAKPRLRFGHLLRRYFLGIVLILVALWSYAFFGLGQVSVYRAHPELSATERASAILANVAKLIELPNEEPTVAIISDASSAKRTQPFLARAQNGDVLILYPMAQEALLYRPAINKLIAIGPVDNSPVAPAVEAAPPAATSTNATTTAKSKK